MSIFSISYIETIIISLLLSIFVELTIIFCEFKNTVFDFFFSDYSNIYEKIGIFFLF